MNGIEVKWKIELISNKMNIRPLRIKNNYEIYNKNKIKCMSKNCMTILPKIDHLI